MAEKLYQNDNRVHVRSRGTTRNAVQTISLKDLQWADVVLVMEDKHRKRLLTDFPDGDRFKPIHVLDIPDDYRFMDPELVNHIRTAAEPLIDAMLNN